MCVLYNRVYKVELTQIFFTLSEGFFLTNIKFGNSILAGINIFILFWWVKQDGETEGFTEMPEKKKNLKVEQTKRTKQNESNSPRLKNDDWMGALELKCLFLQTSENPTVNRISGGKLIWLMEKMDSTIFIHS